MNKEKDIPHFMVFWQNWIFLKNLFLKTNFVGSCRFITEARTLIAMYIWLQRIALIIEDNKTFDTFWIWRSTCEIWEKEKSFKHSFIYYDYLVTVLFLQEWKPWFTKYLFEVAYKEVEFFPKAYSRVLQRKGLTVWFYNKWFSTWYFLECPVLKFCWPMRIQYNASVSFLSIFFKTQLRDTEKRCK